MPNYFLNTGTNSWVERPAAGYLPQRYAVTELPAFEMGLAMDIGTIIGHAFVDLVPLEMGLAMPSGSVNQSAALPEFSLGLSMDIGDAFLVRYVSLPSLDMGILPAFGDVLQVAALPSMDMGLEIDGPAIVVSVPLPNIDRNRVRNHPVFLHPDRICRWHHRSNPAHEIIPGPQEIRGPDILVSGHPDCGLCFRDRGPAKRHPEDPAGIRTKRRDQTD